LNNFSEIFSRSLRWAIGIAVLVFFLFSFVFVGNLGPIPALVYGPLAFVVSFVVFFVIETLIAANSRLSRKNTYIGLFVVCLVPIVYILAFEPLAFGIDYKAITRDFSRTKRMEHAPPLTEQERLLLQSTRLNLKVGVDAPSAYAKVLIRDLQETCLFKEVGILDQLDGADMLATIKIPYSFDGRVGWLLSLRRPEMPKDEVNVQVYYWLRNFGMNTKADRNQYTDRLAVELIKASQTIFGQDELRITDSMDSAPNVELPCKRNNRKICDISIGTLCFDMRH
jgi:hypothetical protein